MSGRYWLDLPGGFEVGLPPPALVRPAPGERTISNAEVPLPRSPLSLAAGTVLRTGFLSVLRRTGDAEGSPPGRIPDWQVEPVPRGFSHGNARGEAPCIRKLKVSPFPLGRGAGDGGNKASQRQGQQATKKASPPADTTAARSAGDQSGKPPLRTPQRHGQPATSRASPRIGYSNGRSSRQRKNTPLTPKETRFTLDRLPAFMYNYNEKGGSMARIPPPDTRFEQFVKIRICIDNHVTVCYNSDTAEEPRRNAP